MKITRVETIPIQVPIKPDLAIRAGRGGAHLKSPFLIVKIHTDKGITGLGEVSCTPRWSGEDSFTAGHFINKYFAPLLEDSNPCDIEMVMAKVGPAIAGNHFTKSAIEMALWDIRGKAEGLPVYELLGGAARETIPTKWSISGVEPDRAAGIATWAIEQGFSCMKVKVGIDPDGDVARVRAVRAAVGDKIKLGVDANGGWDIPTAVATIERLLEFQIYFAEQPVPQHNMHDLAEVRQRLREKNISLPIVADESVYTPHDAENLAREKACDVFSVYIGKAGGINPARSVASVAGKHRLGCTIGSNLEMGIGSAAMLHLACSTRDITAEAFPCDIIGPFFYEADLLRERLDLTPGAAKPPRKPGLGVELDDRLVAQFRVD